MPITKQEAGEIINTARRRLGLSWANIAIELDAPQVWAVSAILGQHPLSQAQAEKLVELVKLDSTAPASFSAIDRADVLSALTAIAYRGPVEIPSDPTLYRFFEAMSVYGPALKELMFEEFGDGIMSAINFGITLERKANPAGDRVVVTLDGKFLDYAWSPE